MVIIHFKGNMLVHLWLPVDTDPFLELLMISVKVIEDDKSHRFELQRTPMRSLGQISTFSFYPNKHITTGEGGMILTRT